MLFPDWSSLFSLQALPAYGGGPAQWSQGYVRQADITAELGSRLSPNASILLPGSAAFSNATLRWQHYRSPHFRAAVAVYTEEDVQETILFANKHDIPFLAMVGGHGTFESLGNVHNGIEIWLRPMNSVEVSEDGTYATIQGGTKVKETVDALWAKGKRAASGVCECVGMLGPILGGGHGFLQGQYGLAADQLIEVRVVLANGTAVTASSDSHPDLFWALRGAGHNFGIVTEMKYKIYDVDTTSMWAQETFVFTSDKLEQVYEVANELRRTQPPEAVVFGVFTKVPDIDPTDAILLVWLLYDGTPSALREFSAPMHGIDAISVQAGEIPYRDLPAMTLSGDDTLGCRKGSTALRFPVYLKTYDTKALRIAYDTFNSAIQAEPALASSVVLLEGYSTQGVQAVAENSTAYPYRSDNILVSPAIIYAPNATLDASAINYGKLFRDALVAGSESTELHAYVNYAFGDETLEQLYGHQPWRLEKLRKLKKAYDPEERFNFYAPLS